MSEEDRAPRVQALAVLSRHYDVTGDAFRILVTHSMLVARKAREIALHHQDARGGDVDLDFLEEISLLHDIGIGGTHAPSIDCHGDAPYLQHGIIGRKLLEDEGLPVHALACERHTGSGITRAQIAANDLPLPADRDYV
ncbi:MAG: HD domain-containing protein, partial [Planctomycetota bacterium]